MARTPNDQVKEFVVRLPVEMHQQVAERSADEERTMSATVRLALKRYLATPA